MSGGGCCELWVGMNAGAAAEKIGVHDMLLRWGGVGVGAGAVSAHRLGVVVADRQLLCDNLIYY